MANIQTLSVSLVARTAAFTKGLDRAQTRLTAFSTAMAGLRTGAAGIAVAAIGGAAVGLAAMTRSGFQSVDAVGDLASRLGIGAKELQGFQLAAELAGASQSALTSGISRMQVTLGQAQAGAGSAQRAFSSLGLNFQQLAAAGPAEAFRSVADRISTLGTQTEKAAAAQAIFGRGGVQLLGVLAQGRAGLDASTEQMRRFGEITVAGAQAVDVADQNLILANQAFLAIKQTLAQQLAPWIARSAQHFITWAESGEGAGLRIANALNTVLGVFGAIGKSIDFIQAGVQTMAGNVLTAMSKIVGVFDNDLGKRLESSAQAAFADAQKNFANVFGQDSLRNATGFFNFVKDKAEETSKAFDPRKQALLETISGIVEKDAPGRRAATDIGEFLQIDRTRTALGGFQGRGEQTVKDPQLIETNELLREVVKRLAGELMSTAA